MQHKNESGPAMKKLPIAARIEQIFGARLMGSRRTILLGTTVLSMNLFVGGAYSAGSQCQTTNGIAGAAPAGNVCTISSTFNPVNDDALAGSAYIIGGDEITLTGLASQIAPGNPGNTQTTLLFKDMDGGNVLIGKSALVLGSQGNPVLVPDPITNSTITVSTYTTANLSESSWENSGVTIYASVGNEQYINTRFATVKDGTVNIQLGDMNADPLQPTVAPNGPNNGITMAAKQSNLVYADGTDGDTSAVNWLTSNRFVMNAFYQDPLISGTLNYNYPVYAGSISAPDGNTYIVNNLAGLQAYNNALINMLEQGDITSQAAYDTEFNKAFTIQSGAFTYTETAAVTGDITVARANNIIMLAVGANASATLKAGAHLEYHIEGGPGAAMAVREGAIATIEQNAQLSGDFVGLTIENKDTRGINNGVMSGGYFPTDVNSPDKNFSAVGAYMVVVSDEGSFENNGIMNVAGYNYWAAEPDTQTNYGMVLQGASQGTNNGIINVGVNNNANYGSIAGAIVQTGSQFTNTNNALIYLGRAAQYDINSTAPHPDPDVEAAKDTTNRRPQFGILLMSGVAENDGTITIGSGTQNGTAMAATASGVGFSLTNNGSININGRVSGSTFQNIGMAATNSGDTDVVNNGVINVDGWNGVGLKVVGTAKGSSTATSSITVGNGINVDNNTRNYAVWAEGTGANVDLDGQVILNGRDAIGVHARSGATIAVDTNSAVQFTEVADPATCTTDCSNQIGYFLYGANSTINSTATTLNVNTSGSTLMRIEDGASFNGQGENLIASGKSATILHATGVGASVNTVNATMDIAGGGATGIKVDGGGSAAIDQTTTINLIGEGATAGQVDGRKANLMGVFDNVNHNSVLNNLARIDSTALNAVGFITQYGGRLVNEGDIDLSNGVNNTGIIIRNGGVLDNKRNVMVANGTGILVEGAGSDSLISNTGDIIVNDGLAGIYLRDGAVLRADSSQGDIIVNGTANGILVGTAAGGVNVGANTVTVNGTGNGVENIAEASVNTFTGTIINVAQGAGIYSKTMGTTASQFALSNVQLTAAKGWALNADGGSNDFSVAQSTMTGDTGLLHVNNNGVASLSANAASLRGIITTDAGSTSRVSLTAGSVWTLLGSANVTTLDNTNSVIKLGKENAFNTLTVGQNYTANDAALEINTQLGRDDSPTDKLVIAGDSSGNTLVTVNNVGGRGGRTSRGIEVVTVAGQSDGEFKAANRVTAGVYEYVLARGDAVTGNANNWYLTSAIAGDADIYRPEVGTYMNNLFIANAMFNMRLYDRLGETQYIDALTGEKKVTSLWIRQFGSHNTFSSADGHLDTRNNRYVAQVGGDIASWSTDGLNRTLFGAMAGYGTNDGSTSSDQIDSRSTGNTDGYSVGVYGTYYANDKDRSGLYVDGWALYNWFDATVKGDNRDKEKYKLKGVTASIEAGYTFKVGQNNSLTNPSNYYVQPVVQVTYMGVTADDHLDQEGVVVQTRGGNNIQTRVGVRAFMQNEEAINKGTGTSFEPFVEANWINNSKRYSAVMDEVEVKQQGGKNIGELKLGVQRSIGKNTGFWANVAYQFNNDQYRDVQATIGIKHSF
jgi:autotransporter family porin